MNVWTKCGALGMVLVLGLVAGSVTAQKAGHGKSTTAPTDLPKPVGACPELREGTVAVRDAKVRVLARGKSGRGPLILYWHGTDSSPEKELAHGLGEATLRAIRAHGGLVVGMLSGFGTGANTSGNGVWREGDMAIADEVVACALEAGIVVPNRIHVLGMSAGALQTVAFAYSRSNYVASVVTYSGGHVVFNGKLWTDTHATQADNHFAALIFHGGQRDFVGMSFQEGSEAFFEELQRRGHFALLCDHSGGHVIPPAGGRAALRFFRDNPFGSRGYGSALPPEIPSFCER